MIAKGNLHAHGGKLAAYLTTGKKGERAELMELRGFAATNIRDAFTDVQIQAMATRSTKPFFHVYVRLPEGEALARAQWRKVADRLEHELGFDGQGRAVAFHHGPEGETHMHIAWSRIDLETMRAIDPGLYKNKLKALCRDLEEEFHLTRVRNARDEADKTKAAGRQEFEQARRLGTDLKAIRTTIHDCWHGADNGRAFAAALDEHGLMLARGDKRDFVIIDREGGDHALSKRITGATAAATRDRLADLDRAALPSVTEAKRMQQEREMQERTAALAQVEAIQAPAPLAPAMPIPAQQEPVLDAAQLARDAAKLERNAANAVNAVNAVDRGTSAALMVTGQFAGAASEVVHKLADVVDGLLEMLAPAAPARRISAAEYAADPAARRAYQQQQTAQRDADQARAAALERMQNDIAAGKHLRVEDVRNLQPADLQNIKARGDAHVLDMIAQHERDRRHEYSTGREREHQRGR